MQETANIPITTPTLSLLIELAIDYKIYDQSKNFLDQIQDFNVENLEALQGAGEMYCRQIMSIAPVVALVLSEIGEWVAQNKDKKPLQMPKGFFDAISIMDHNLTHDDDMISDPDDFDKVSKKRQRELRKMYGFLVEKQRNGAGQTEEAAS